jgi:hypothetical protein
LFRPLADALLALDRDAEAEAVMEAAEDPPAEFRAWRAVFAAVAGRTDDAAEQSKAVDRVGQPDGVRLLLAMADALVAVQRGGPFAEARDNLRAAADACAAADVPPGAGRWWRKVADRLAADAGTVGARFWALRQRVRPWVAG